ncbi:exopolysaccharide biosynthesis protein [Maritalea mobilis]|uniref:exopolysaccharide biosynthesis protein n=1 Tax=Maritalea mobilis TaxID=483324 RepID=UPI001C983887|nr:exopolysaccharide biosynthesis protein [Maritalea mobilis]MBY6201076.1 exopolysaccharide biosynthesis protein [Maritalea mobilis]
MPDIAPTSQADYAPQSLTDLLNDVADLNDHATEPPTLQTVLHAFGRAGVLPVLITVALIVVSPLSGIPLLSSFAGLTIAGIALQLAAGRHSLWLPKWLCQRSVPRDRLDRAVDKLRPLARFLDRQSRPRLRVLTTPPMSRVLLLLCGLGGLAMPFMELLPFSSSLMAMAVVLTGFAILTRDGLWAIVAGVPMILALGVILTAGTAATAAL